MLTNQFPSDAPTPESYHDLRRMQLLQQIVNKPQGRSSKDHQPCRSSYSLRLFKSLLAAARPKVFSRPRRMAQPVNPPICWTVRVTVGMIVADLDAFNLKTCRAAEHSKFTDSTIQLIPDSRRASLAGEDEQTNSLAPCSESSLVVGDSTIPQHTHNPPTSSS